MGHFVNERRIRMRVLWTIIGVLGLFVPELNASTSSNSHFITASSFVSRASSSKYTIAQSSSIQDTTSTANGGISTTGIPLTADASNSTTATQPPSSTVHLVSPSASSNLKTETSILSILATRTSNQSSIVPLNAAASQSSINGVISTSSSVHFSNSLAETSSALSVLFSLNDSSSTVSEIRTSNAWPSSLLTSVNEGSQSILTSLSSGSVSINRTSSNSVSSAVNPSGSVSATRTLFMNQSFTSVAEAAASPSQLLHSRSVNVTTNYGSSTGLPSESVSPTSVLQLDTSHSVLSSSVVMVTNRTLSSSYSTSIYRSSSTSSSKSVNDSSSTVGVSIAISASSTAKSNDTVLLTEALVTVNSTVTTLLTSKTGVSSTVSHSSYTAMLSALQGTSSVANSTLKPSAILSSMGHGGNRTSSVSSTYSASLLSSQVLNQINQTVAAVTTSATLPSNVTVALHTTPFTTGSSAVDKGVGSSIANYTSVMSSALIMSVTVSPSLLAPQNATSQSSRSILLNTFSKVTPLSSVFVGVVSTTVVTSETSKPLAVSPSLMMSHNTTRQFVETSSLSSPSVAPNSSVIAASFSSVSNTRVVSLTTTVTPEMSSSKLLTLPSLMVSPNVTSHSSLSGGLTQLSKTPSSSRPMSLSSSLSSNKTSTNEEFLVTSYSTPCYIYYVVEKTVLPLTTANHSIIPETTPKVTLDIGSATNLHSVLPTVTLTYPVTMTTQLSEVQTQVVVMSDAPGSSATSMGGSSTSSTASTLVSSRSSIEATLLSSQPDILPSETVTKVLSTDTDKATNSSTFMFSTVLPDPVSTSSTSTAVIVATESSQLQSNTLLIPFITATVSELLSASTTNGSLGFSPMTSSKRFTPTVSTPSVSDKQNLSIDTAAPTLPSSVDLMSKQQSFQSTHVASITATSSAPSRVFVSSVASPQPSQSISNVTTSGGVSQMMSNSTTVIQASEGSFLSSTSVASETLKASIPSNASSVSIQVLISVTSSTLSNQPQNVTGTSSLVKTTSILSQAPTLSIVTSQTASNNISSSLIATVSQFQMASTDSKSSAVMESSEMLPVNSSGAIITSSVKATMSSSFVMVMATSSMSIYASPNSTSRSGGQQSSVIPTSSRAVSQGAATSTSIASVPQMAASSSLLLVGNQSSAPSTIGKLSVGPSSSANETQVGGILSSSVNATSQRAAATISLPYSNNSSSSSSLAVVPSSLGIRVSPSTRSSASGQLLSAMPSSFGTVSLTGGTSSLSHGANTFSVINSTPSTAVYSSSTTLPLFGPAKKRRKKRAIGDNSNSTVTVVHSVTSVDHLSSSIWVTSPSSPSQLSPSGVASILATFSLVNQSSSVMQTSVVRSSVGLAPSSLPRSSGQPQILSTTLFPGSVITSSSQQLGISSHQQGNLTKTAASFSSSFSGQTLTLNAQSSVATITQSTSTSFHSSSTAVESHASTTVQILSSVSMFVVTPSGTVSLSSQSVRSSTESPAAVQSTVANASLFLTQVEDTVALLSTSKPVSNATSFTPSMQSSLPAASGSLDVQSSIVDITSSSVSADIGTLPSTPLVNLLTSSSVFRNSTLTPVSTVSIRHSLSAAVTTSSSVVESLTLLSASSHDLMTSSMVLGSSNVTQSTTSVSSSKQSSSMDVAVPSTVVVNGTFPSTSSATVDASSALLADRSSRSVSFGASSQQASSTGMIMSPTSELLSSPTSGYTSETLQQTFSSSRAIQPSLSTSQSRMQQTAVSSSVTSSSSSFVYRPPLVTISSLGICYVVYTTRLIQPTLTPTPQVNMSLTASVSSTSAVNASFTTQVLPSVSLNTSSVVLLPILTVNFSRTQSLAVNATVTPGDSSSSSVSLTTVPTISSRTSSVASSISVSLLSSTVSVLSKTPPVTTTQVSSSLQVSTSQMSLTSQASSSQVSSTSQASSSQVISPTRTFSQAVSSSVSVTITPAPDSSLLLWTTLVVPQSTDIQSKQFKEELEANLAEAYSFAEVSFRRRRRATGTTATVQSIQRLNNGDNVNVIFYVAKSGQGVPAVEAAQNYNRLNKNQFTRLVKLDVITMPQPLVTPTTSPVPASYLVSLIIQNYPVSNISIPANKKKLESNLASYYKDKKQLPTSTNVTATIQTILHEPNDKAYLEFYMTVGGEEVNRTAVVQTFEVPNVNLLTAQLGVQVLVGIYIPDSLSATEYDHVIIGINVNQNQDLQDAAFRNELANKLGILYVEAKGRKNARRKRRSGSTSATIVDIVRNSNTAMSEADVTFFVFDSGAVANGTYVASLLNRLSTGEMTTYTMPYAVLTAPRPALVPSTPTEVVPTVAATPIKWWIIPAVICPILLIIVIILLVCWRWKKGAPKAKVEPDTIRMLETNRSRAAPVHGFDVARFTEPGVSGMKTTAFMSARDKEEESEKPARRQRETSLRRKVGKPPIQKLPTREQRLTNPAFEEEEEEEEEEENESGASVTPTGSTEVLVRSKATSKSPSATKRTPAPTQRVREPQRSQEPQRTQDPQRQRELSDDESEEESEVSEEESETEPESEAPPTQMKHSAAQVPTVAVMGEASGPPRYPPVRFRSSVHPAPSLPPLNPKQTSLVGVKVEPPSEDERGRKRGKVTKRELEQRADLERQKNKQRLRDRKRDSARTSLPPERRAWDRAQHDFDDVLEEGEAAERVITGKSGKRRRRRPPSSSLATDEEGAPQLKSFRKLKSPKTTSSTTSTRDRGKKHGKSTGSVSNETSDESEIDMNETRRRMHAMLDDAFALFGPQTAKKLGMEPEGQSPQPEGYPAPPARPAVIPRFVGGQSALPEPPPAHGRATEPTPGQRRRVQPTMPGYPAAMAQTPIGMPGYPGRPPVRPVVTRDPIVVWDPADRQRILNQRAPPPTYAYRDPSGQNVYITPVQQQRDDMGGLVWSPYTAEDTMDTLYPDLAQAGYPGTLGTTPPKDASFLSQLQAAPPHDTILNMSPSNTLDQRGTSLGQSPQPLIKSIKGELFRLSQGATRKTPITEL